MPQKKRILYIITKSNFGGAQRYVYELATNLPQEGYEAHVALGGEGALKSKLSEAGISNYQLYHAQRDINLLKEVRLFGRLISIIKQVQPDVVHLNSPKIGGLGALAARICGVKNIIYTNHGWPFKEERPHWQVVLIKILSWITVFLSKKTIVLSERERQMTINWPFAKKKLSLIPIGLFPFEASRKVDALTTLLGKSKADHIVDEHMVVLGTIAELHKNKGLIYAIEGFAQSKDERMIFIIIGEGEERPHLEAKIKELGLSQKVFLLGQIENARAYLNAFDYFILPSIKEGLPYVLLEAGSKSIPIIATHVGGIPELIHNLQEGLIISPRRPREIKQALIYMREHDADIRVFASNLKTKIDIVYSFEQMKDKTLKLYTPIQ